MVKQSAAAAFTALTLQPASSVPLYRQLYDELRRAVLEGRLARGTQLPSTRVLASEIGISRTTVITAFEQLIAEGYVEGKIGSGTYVSRELPDDLARARSSSAPQREIKQGSRALSRRGTLLAGTRVSTAPDEGQPRAFRPGLPAFDLFPFREWARIASRYERRPPRGLLAYGNPAGYEPLRQAIATYLAVSRGVRCDSQQVIVVAGSQQAIDLAVRLLLDPGDPVWVEDPGYMGARGALLGAGATIVPVHIDAEGLDIVTGLERCPGARVVCVTPSHQFPLGVTMSLARRLALLEWASRSGAWVLEDDYDSELRYRGRPLAALQGLDDAGRVVYVGTFSKVLFPSLRLGYLVAPPDLVDAFVAARSLIDRHPPAIQQAILAEFMAEGHFMRHIRRMRVMYAERQASLIEAAQRNLAGLLELRPGDAGMHLVGRLPPGRDDAEASRRAAAHGVDAPPLSAYGIEAALRPGLVLGYAALTDREIREGVKRLSAALAL